MPSFALELAAKGVGLLLAFSLMALLLKKASAAVRHGVWALAFVGLAALPLLVRGLPALEIERPVLVPSRSLAVTTDRPLTEPAPKVSQATPPSTFELTEATTPTFPWENVLGAVWGVGVLLILGRTGACVARAEAIARRGEISHERGIRLVRSPEVDVPMTFGLLRPTILLPEAADGWPEARMRSVWLHEEAHIRRRDWAWLLFARLVAALYWPNPLVWWAEARLRSESEMAADDAVVAAGVPADRYAETLVEIAADIRAAHRAYALPIIERTTLKGRVREVLRRAKSRRPLTLRTALVALALGAAGVLPFAAARLVQGQPTVDSGHMDLGNGRQLSILGITEIEGETIRSWDMDGALLPEAWPVPPRMREVFDMMEGKDGPPLGTVRRYVVFRNNWEGDQLFDVSLDGSPETLHLASYDFENITGVYSPQSDVGRGHYLVARIDFPTRRSDTLEIVAPSEPFEEVATARFASGALKGTSDPGFRPSLAKALGETLEVTFDIPRRFANEQTAFEVWGRGKMPDRMLIAPFAQGEQTRTVYAPDGPNAVESIVLKRRSVRSFAFGDIPLNPDPKAAYAPPKLAIDGLVRAKNGEVRLADGAWITLQAVGEVEPHSAPAWRPDGTPTEGFRWRARPGEDIRPVLDGKRAMRFQMKRSENVSLFFDGIYDESGRNLPASGGWTVGDRDGTFDLKAFLVPTGRRSLSLLVNVAIGPDRIRDRGRVGDGRFRAGEAPPTPENGEQTLVVNGPSGVFQAGPQESITIQLLQRGGKPITEGYAYYPDELFSKVTFQLDPKLAAKVDGFQIKVRPTQWIEFPNVHLYPNP